MHGELDARINHAFDTIREATEKRRKLEGKEKSEEPISNEEIDKMRFFVIRHALTPEWPSLIDRIDQGEVTWRQAVERDGALRDDTPGQDEKPAPRRPTKDHGDDDSFENPDIRGSF